MVHRPQIIGITALVAFTAAALWLSGDQASKAAAPQNDASRSALILVQNPKQIPVVLKTCEELLTNPKYNVKQARVLVCGPAIHAIVSDSENIGVISQANKTGVQIDACGISLKKLDVSADQLADGVSHVENALLTAFELKADGWISIDL